MSAPDFIDECRIFVRSGDGGRGCCSFRREKFVPRGGPDGGNGGRGGSVRLIADRQLATLLDTRHRKFYRAPRGAHGSGARKDGKWGEDVEVRLPLGTVVKDDETREVLVELIEDGQSWLAVEGGLGGRGNAMFATSTNQAPLTVEPGQRGRGALAAARAEGAGRRRADRLPERGQVDLHLARVRRAAEDRELSVHDPAAAPGHGRAQRRALRDRRHSRADPRRVTSGLGLGHRFLRHVERTRVLVHLLDPEPCLAGGDAERSPERDYDALRAELSAYSEDLAKRHELVCISKADLVPDPAERALLAEPLLRRGLAVRWISAATGEGLDPVLQELVREVGKK